MITEEAIIRRNNDRKLDQLERRREKINARRDDRGRIGNISLEDFFLELNEKLF